MTTKVLPFVTPHSREREPLIPADAIAWDITEWNRRFPSGSLVAMAWAALAKQADKGKSE